MEERKGIKYKILFVCLGNICRSPTAEGVMKSIIKENGADDLFYIDSAGINGYHTGEKADSRMRKQASKRGYDLTSRSRRIKPLTDYDDFDMVIGMDNTNIKDLKALAPSDEARSKIFKMTDFAINRSETVVPDPYYGGVDGFDLVLDILEDCCQGLFDKLK